MITSNEAANKLTADLKLEHGDQQPSASVARALIHPQTNEVMAYINAAGLLVDASGVPIGASTWRRAVTLTKALPATGSVVFTGQPTDGQTVTIDDGVNDPVVFEVILSGNEETGSDVEIVAMGTFDLPA